MLNHLKNPKAQQKELFRLKRLGNAALRSIKAGLEAQGDKYGLPDIMQELGFKDTSFGHGQAFLHPKDGYVFKLAYLVGRKEPLMAIPTWSKKTKFGQVQVQPQADTSATALREFALATTWATKKHMLDRTGRTRTEDYLTRKGIKHLGRDCHEENCGMYKGQPVVFDW